MGEMLDNSNSPAFFSQPLSRRQFLARAAFLAASPALAGAFLSACGGSGTASQTTSASASAVPNPTGTATLMNFPGWIGPSAIPDFEKQYPGAKIHLYTQVPSSLAGYVQLIKNNPGAYDMALADLTQILSLIHI